MKTTRQIALGSLFLVSVLHGQNVTQEAPEDPVQRAIREFNQRDRSQPNEVTVVLGAPDTPPPPAEESQEPPVLVTGTPPEDQEVVAESTTTTESPPLVETPAEPPKGLSVRIEKVQSGDGPIDPKEVKLLAPFPAKALSKAPPGWKIQTSEHAPSFQREVELAPGRKITLEVRPHLLIPDADGSSVIQVSEPGFDPALGYRQNATVGAVLSNSIRQLDEDSRALGSAIDNLQQLLVSLPTPDPAPAPDQNPKPAGSSPAKNR